MKTLKMIASVFMAMILCANLSSCDDDVIADNGQHGETEGGTETEKVTIVGEWKAYNINGWEKDDNGAISTLWDDNMESESFFMSFSADGKVHELEIDGDGSRWENDYTWSQQGNILKLIKTDGTEDYDIKTLTADTLIIASDPNAKYSFIEYRFRKQ